MIFLNNLWDLFVDMSFYLVIGLIFTGILHVFVNKEMILKHVGNNTTGSVVKASVVGVPLPLCSCGVVPTALFLEKSGASKGAVISFLTSTPQTGVDSIIATYGLMGPLFAFYRAIAAFLSGIFGGIVTNVLCKNAKTLYTDTAQGDCHSSCCESKKETTCGCGNMPCDSPKKNSILKKIIQVFTYAFGEFLEDITIHFLIGLFVAALISTLLPEQILSSITNPFLSMILMLIIGIPMYICSTASIPIALSLMMKGITPGAAFVFLFAGPVTNIASLAMLVKTLGKKVLLVYLGSVAICSILFGLLLDYLIELTNYQGINSILSDTHEHDMPVYMYIVAIVFAILLLRCILVKYVFKKKTSECGCH